MNKELLNVILTDEDKLNKCLEWLSSEKNETGEHGYGKNEFVIFFLSFLRTQTVRLFDVKKTSVGSGSVTKGNNKRKESFPPDKQQWHVVKPLSTGETVRRIFSPEQDNPSNTIIFSPDGQVNNYTHARHDFRNLSPVERSNAKIQNNQRMFYNPQMPSTPQMQYNPTVKWNQHIQNYPQMQYNPQMQSAPQIPSNPQMTNSPRMPRSPQYNPQMQSAPQIPSNPQMTNSPRMPRSPQTQYNQLSQYNLRIQHKPQPLNCISSEISNHKNSIENSDRSINQSHNSILNQTAFSPPNQRNRSINPTESCKMDRTPKEVKSNSMNVVPNSSGFSNRSSLLSPESPHYPDQFPKLGDGKSQKTQKSAVGTQPKKAERDRKRIKPTSLPLSPSDSQISGLVSRAEFNDAFTKVTECYASDSNLLSRTSNFDEERKVLKEKNNTKEEQFSILRKSGEKLDSNNLLNNEELKGNTPSIEMNGENETKPASKASVSNQESNPIKQSEPREKFVIPEPSKVMNQKLLSHLAEIYSVLLDRNLVFNITSEIHFVVSLLTLKVIQELSNIRKNSLDKDPEPLENDSNVKLVCTDEKNIRGIEKLEECDSSTLQDHTSVSVLKEKGDNENANFQDVLNDVHQCVYFACTILAKQMSYVQLLDKMSLKLLLDNERIESFVPHLKQKLEVLYSLKNTASKSNIHQLNQTNISEICPVQFHMETDNRDTFCSNVSFSTFRKQRDELYDILQTWNKMHDQTEWNFNKVSSRVVKLLAMSSDPVNIRHLAKHFCDLLLKAVSCEENSVEALDYLPDINKSKLSLLTKRLTEPSSGITSSARPESNFPGLQQFYHDFLIVASQNFMFNIHLINCLVSEIVLRNNATYDIDESDGEGQAVHGETRQMFLQGINSLCVLAKFLGLVVFAPYRTSSKLSKTVLQEEIKIRKQIEVPLNLKQYFDDAAKRGGLVYTVPWIVEYLGMMDEVAPYLPQYENILVSLLNLYLFCTPHRTLSLPEIAPRQSINEQISISDVEQVKADLKHANERIIHLAPLASSLLRLCLGWLFDSSNLDQDVFAKLFLQSDVDRFTEERGKTVWKESTMDSSDLVNYEIISKLCPYLKSLHALLSRKDTAELSSVKHITPIRSNNTIASSSIPQISPEVALQLQLEEHFFMGQSESVKRTVEFVSERIASACIKHVISTVIVSLKKKVRDLTSAQKKDKVDLQPFILEYNESVMQQLNKVREERLGIALKALFGPDMKNQSIIDLCQQIASRKSQERVVNWLQAHINIEDLLLKAQTLEDECNDDENDDLAGAGQFNQSSNNGVNRPNSYLSVDDITVCSSTFIHLQDISSDALTSSGKQGLKNSKELMEFFPIVDKAALKSPSYSITKHLLTSLVDYILLMISFVPEQVSDDVIESLSDLIKKHDCDEVVSHIWSQRNVMLLCQANSNSFSIVWKKFSRLVVSLVKANILSVAKVEEQAISLFRCDWPDNVLKAISKSLRSTLMELQRSSVDEPEFFLMLNLLSGIAIDISTDDMCGPSITHCYWDKY